MFTNPLPRPKPNSPEAHLEGFGVVITMKMRKRLIERLKAEYPDVEPAPAADWMIRRMADKRLKEGLEMDKTIAAARKMFLPALMRQALKTVSGGK